MQYRYAIQICNTDMQTAETLAERAKRARSPDTTSNRRNESKQRAATLPERAKGARSPDTTSNRSNESKQRSHDFLNRNTKSPCRTPPQTLTLYTYISHSHYTLCRSGDFLNWLRKSMHWFNWFATLNSKTPSVRVLCWDSSPTAVLIGVLVS